jgi:hypothetical protein
VERLTLCTYSMTSEAIDWQLVLGCAAHPSNVTHSTMDQNVQIQYLTSKHISALVSSILPAVEHFLLNTLSMTFDPID